MEGAVGAVALLAALVMRAVAGSVQGAQQGGLPEGVTAWRWLLHGAVPRWWRKRALARPRGGGDPAIKGEFGLCYATMYG